jgi:hypothetical protein
MSNKHECHTETTPTQKHLYVTAAASPAAAMSPASAMAAASPVVGCGCSMVGVPGGQKEDATWRHPLRADGGVPSGETAASPVDKHGVPGGRTTAVAWRCPRCTKSPRWKGDGVPSVPRRCPCSIEFGLV